MPIAIERKGETCKLAEEQFRNEEELQAYLERSPYLLINESEPRVITVQREVRLPSAGSLDLLLVDAEGVPVAVEVKLGRNSQARREVLAQAFDYISDLTMLTVDELDDAVDGALITALDKLTPEKSGVDLRKQCGTNLRAGRIKVVVAVDEANDDLLRIVRYVNEHSDLDVRLVAISRFDRGRLLVPKILVSGSAGMPMGQRRGGSIRPADPVFEAVVRAYDDTAPDSLQTRGHGKTFRQIRPDDWPRQLHYEYLNTEDEIGVELHLESEEVRHLANNLSALNGKELLPQLLLQWDPHWSRKRGRLFAKLSKVDPPEKVANAMVTLIEKTRPVVEAQIKLRGMDEPLASDSD